MKRIILTILIYIGAFSLVSSQKITYHASDCPATVVFSDLMRLSGYNFSYDASLLKKMRVTVNAVDVPIDTILTDMFADKGITFSIIGRNIILKRKHSEPDKVLLSGTVSELSSGETLIGALVTAGKGHLVATNSFGNYSLSLTPGIYSVTVSYPGFDPITKNITIGGPSRLDFSLSPAIVKGRMLNEVLVTTDRKTHIAMNTPDIGRVNLSAAEIAATPVMFGESDVIKALHYQPGVSSGVEGLATMYVHGGDNDENLYMLDNVPLYQVNHFGGLFSAFNTEAIKNVDFYKTSFPARYNGRLSSVMSVNTLDGDSSAHHGSFRLGLTSGALAVKGPLFSSSTTYSLALRRSWFDAITVPALAIYNSYRPEKGTTTIARYAFTDINAKLTHRFSATNRIHFMFYFGDDYLKGGEKTHWEGKGLLLERNTADVSRLRWGNILGSAGWRFQLSPDFRSELTASFSRYNSSLQNLSSTAHRFVQDLSSDRSRLYYSGNRITDVSLRADFDFNPSASHRFNFGLSAISHSFVPQDESSRLYSADTLFSSQTSFRSIKAFESMAYLGYDADLTSALRLSAGLNAGIFRVGSRSKTHCDPRVSLRWRLNDLTSLKLAYARTTQYIHQLTESSLSLPTDRWVPVSGSLSPMKADKIAAGVYRRLPNGFTLSAEVYYKWLHNLIDYRDYYFLEAPGAPWQKLVCNGSGRARGIDLMFAREYGRLSGHIAYSLLFADRLFPDKNGGERFPARFDNRHKINLLLSWKIDSRWEINAGWTGMSGNRVTLSSQDYILLPAPGLPTIGQPSFTGVIDLSPSLNNYRLPFYHRLDLGANRHTKHGMWNFSIYNAYCYMNVISLRKTPYYDSYLYTPYSPKFKKFRLLPMIPSVSYTWLF